jgi:predicted ArsR family transcriptional regulator
MPTVKPKMLTKSAIVIALLSRGKGASIDEICKATKWQTHSVRAFLTGLRKKGIVVTRKQRGQEGTAYRITQTPDQNAGPEAS